MTTGEYQDGIGYFHRKNFLERYDIYKQINMLNDSTYFKVYQELLDLGYDSEMTNTILYTYFIVEVYNNLERENLENELVDPFSQFYLDLKDSIIGMGPRTFHSNLLMRDYRGTEMDKLAVATYGLEALNIAKSLKVNNKLLTKAI